MILGGIVLIALAVALSAASEAISYVDADGLLHESFMLIPLAWLSGLAGAVLIVVALWRGLRG